MSQAKNGDTVKVHYTGKFKDGTVFDSSEGRDPLQFEIGSRSVIPGFESGVVGMTVGETKTFDVPPEEGYGLARDELVSTVEKTVFDQRNITPEVGQQLQIPQSDGRNLYVRVTEVRDDTVTLDANHPLAGKTLTFEVELVEVA